MTSEPEEALNPASGLSDVVDALLMTLDSATARGEEPPTSEDMAAAAARFLSYPESEEFGAWVAGAVNRLNPYLRPDPAMTDAVLGVFAEVGVAISMHTGRHLGPALTMNLCLLLEVAALTGRTPAAVLAEYVTATEHEGGPADA